MGEGSRKVDGWFFFFLLGLKDIPRGTQMSPSLCNVILNIFHSSSKLFGSGQRPPPEACSLLVWDRCTYLTQTCSWMLWQQEGGNLLAFQSSTFYCLNILKLFLPPVTTPHSPQSPCGAQGHSVEMMRSLAIWIWPNSYVTTAGHHGFQMLKSDFLSKVDLTRCQGPPTLIYIMNFTSLDS